MQEAGHLIHDSNGLSRRLFFLAPICPLRVPPCGRRDVGDERRKALPLGALDNGRDQAPDPGLHVLLLILDAVRPGDTKKAGLDPEVVSDVEGGERGGWLRDLHAFPLSLSPFPTALYLQPIESDQEVLMKYLMQIVPARGTERKATPLLATPPTPRRNFSGREPSFGGISL